MRTVIGALVGLFLMAADGQAQLRQMNPSGGGISQTLVANLPGSPNFGQLFIVTDANGGCTTSGGTSTPLLCRWDSTAWRIVSGASGSGGVTSVGLSMPGIFSVSSSPVTGSGTLAVSLGTQSANRVWAGPTTGSASAPTFRALVGADLPVPSASTLGGVQSLAAVSHLWINTISTSGVPSATQPTCSDLTNSAASCSTDATNASNINSGTLPAARLPYVPTTAYTSGPVADPGGGAYFLVNNASGALTFDLPAGVAGMQRCYRNATGKTGAITIAVTTSNTIDLAGVNGTTSSGTLVSGGALGDAVCLWSDATNHWMAQPSSGTFTNN